MKDASQYPVKWGFGLTAPSPWSKNHPHLGEDRSMVVGTPVIVNGQTIALSGNTGGVDPHLHIQKIQNGKVVSPNGQGFVLPTPASVSETGEKPKIGKFIRIRDAQGVEWSYFHLSQINVTVGQEIGAKMNYETAKKIVMRMGKLGMLPEKQFTDPKWFDYHAKNAVANPDYLAGLGDQLVAKGTLWDIGNWKAVNYDKDVAAAGQSDAAVKLQQIKDALK